MQDIDRLSEVTKGLSARDQQELFDFAKYLQRKKVTDKIQHREPHPEIAGKIKILGNIIDSVPEVDWNLPR